MNEVNDVFLTINKLRDQKTGCAWDKKQTTRTLLKPLKEEVEELAEALAENDNNHIAEELGDVFWNICMLLSAAEEEGIDNKESIIKCVEKKIIGRHPHVFADVEASTPEEAMQAYLKAKKEQRAKE